MLLLDTTGLGELSRCIIVIDSTPPPIAASTPSCMTMCAACTMACRPELQNRLTVTPAVVTGSPARSAATRATLWPCGAVRLAAAEDDFFDLRSDRAAGALPSTSAMQWAARSSGRVMLNEPRCDLASGVRELATMTASLMMMMLPWKRVEDAARDLGEVSVRSARARAEPHDHDVARRNHPGQSRSGHAGCRHYCRRRPRRALRRRSARLSSSSRSAGDPSSQQYA